MQFKKNKYISIRDEGHLCLYVLVYIYASIERKTRKQLGENVEGGPRYHKWGWPN